MGDTTVIADIRGYDDSDSPPVCLRLTRDDVEHPLSVLARLAEDPAGLDRGPLEIRLTESQLARVLSHLRGGLAELRADDSGSPRDADYILVLSFGAGPDVNRDLAAVLTGVLRESRVPAYVQWEVAGLVPPNVGGGRLRPIVLNDGQEYMTTTEVVEKFARAVVPECGDGKANVFLVAQAWHAPRVIRTCETTGAAAPAVDLHVVGGRYVDRFAASDPQEWVRNPFAWVLKEGTRRST